ncbi:MAG: glycosyl hydrolase [Ferruginibacter sp.]
MKKIQVLFLIILSIESIAQTKTLPRIIKNNTLSWFQPYDFNPAIFRNPAQSFGPMARWWWPGNNVTKEELKREINLFADNGFAGVEIQPLNLAIPVMDEKERKKVTSWDTPAYYENLQTVMEEARRRHMIIDVTNGSGWPPGGPFLQPEDGFLSLEFGAVTVRGGEKLSVPLPQANNKTTVPSRLQAVVISRLGVKIASDETETDLLDAASARVVTNSVHNDTLTYTFPVGQWKVIAFWAIPSGEKTNIAAAEKQGPVVDHFDSVKVLKLYNHLFGAKTGLQPYFGNPMRAIFNDSYEFKANRHYAPDFIAYFKKKRGYDVTPWLPANMQRGYNFVAFMRPNAKPAFSFSEQDWRLRYDYDITLGELLGEHFFKTSRVWMEKQGLLHRTQAYGLNMDMIAMAGLASIPETESMLGTEANLKIMSSGAYLYNRPIVSAESVVFSNRGYMTTPQKIKMAVDKLFSAGVNQVIYHGVPYRYTSEKLGPEGWYPFSSPLLGSINFASNLGEGNIFWKDQKEVNEYVNRVQYALRSGKPHADVLIYYPFLNVEGVPDNEEEVLAQGYIEGVEPPLPEPKTKELPDPVKVAWAREVYPFINQLEARGIAWAWVNDASIQEAKLQKNGRINIRGNLFNALILANDSIIQLNTAVEIKLLAAKGMLLLITGSLPAKQPSFLNWKANDRKTGESIAAASKAKNSSYLQQTSELNDWLKKLHQPVKFKDSYSFTRQVQREMSDGSRIHFIWNKSEHWQTFAVTLDKKFKSSYWMDPEAGTTIKNSGSTISYQLPPYGSALLFASANDNIADSILTISPVLVNPKEEILAISKWNIKVDSVEIKDSSLFDWKNHNLLKFSSAEGIYMATFPWEQSNSSRHSFLDLGKVCFTAEVYINKAFAGKRIYSPYLLDITRFLKPGTNTIEVHVTPGQLNDFIGKAKNGDKRYSQFKGKESQVMSAGLLGPVVIRPEK